LPLGGMKYDFIFIFTAAKFPACAEAAGRELRRWLNDQDSSEPMAGRSGKGALFYRL
jgi:hypothetical protein